MLKNYFLTAFRNIIRNKKITFINIFGLSFSMSVCMLIIVIVQDQYSYDDMHSQRDSIYRIQSVDNKSKYALNKYASNTYPLAKELRDNYTFIEKMTVFNNSFRQEASYNDALFSISGLYADKNFFDVFDFELLRGDVGKALEEPYSIIMREDIAQKFFGDEDPLGKSISIEDYGNLRITGIIKKTKEKSHIEFESLVSASTINVRAAERDITAVTEDWESHYSSYIYVIPVEGFSMETIQEALDKITDEKYKDNEKVNVSFYLFPCNKIVPGPILGNEISVAMPKVYLLFFAGMALIIILSASFNYTSLSIARSLTRVKEFGMRKTVGAGKRQIIFQILTEAIFISFLSLILGIAILQLILPAFKGMKLMTLLQVSPDQNLMVYIWFLLFAIITGLLAGILPAVYISRVNPVIVLKGSSNLKILKRVSFRKVLLTIQYIFSIIFLITIILVYRQMIYMTNAEMGFDRNMVYNIHLNGKDYNLVKDRFSRIAEVSDISGGSHVPGVGSLRDTELKLAEEDEAINGHYFSVSPSYVKTMGLEIIAGKDFPEDINQGNELFVIISELAVKNLNMGSPVEAIGQNLIVEDSINLEIIGVMRDYKYCALFLPFRPLLLRVNPDDLRVAALRIQSNNLPETISKFEEEWEKIDPLHPLQGELLDSEIRDYYSYFEDIVYTVGFVSFISIVIACLGLLGMASYSIQTRTREAGIRKVFGAHSKSIIYLFSMSSMKMLLIASIIGGPLAFLLNNAWLEFIPIHAPFGIGTVLAGVFIVLIIGLLTITSQTMTVSNSNPAKILKHE